MTGSQVPLKTLRISLNEMPNALYYRVLLRIAVLVSIDQLVEHLTMRHRKPVGDELLLSILDYLI